MAKVFDNNAAPALSTFVPVQTPSPAVTIRPDMLRIYEEMVFGGLSAGYIPWRSFEDKGAGQQIPTTVWVHTQAVETVPPYREMFAKSCLDRAAACYVIPGVTATREGKASDVAATQIIVADFDDGNIPAKLAHVLAYVGQPTMAVKRGGVTEEGYEKFYLYWRLKTPAAGNDIDLMQRVRRAIAVKAGGDTSVASLHQPIRVAGSIHCKGGHRRLVELVHADPSVTYDLYALATAVEAMPTLEGVGKAIDLNKAGKTTIDHTRALTQPVHEGAVDDITRFDGFNVVSGHKIRAAHEGHITRETALSHVQAWNLSEVRPPWPAERIEAEFTRLWNKHIAEHGPAKARR